MTGLASMFFSRNPARSWADDAARPEPEAPFELVRERVIVRSVTKTLRGMPAPQHAPNTRRAGWAGVLGVELLAASLLLGAGPAKAEETCAQGEVAWEATESGTLEAHPLEGLSIVMADSKQPNAVVFAITYLALDVTCSSTLTPGIEAMVSCRVPMEAPGSALSTYIRIRGNGTAHGQVCTETPGHPAAMPKPKTRS